MQFYLNYVNKLEQKKVMLIQTTKENFYCDQGPG